MASLEARLSSLEAAAATKPELPQVPPNYAEFRRKFDALCNQERPVVSVEEAIANIKAYALKRQAESAARRQAQKEKATPRRPARS